MLPPTPRVRKERFVFIDALRGVAALAVLCHHMLHNSILELTLRCILPRWFTVLDDWGKYGVQIFFVLSGFVITYSLRHSRLDGRAVGRFVLRRQLRLDPPYWCTLALVLAVQSLRLHFPRLVTPPLPGFGTVLLNLVYLQNICHVSQVVGVAWTLCIEIQFYLCFILILAGTARWAGPRQSTVTSGLIFLSGGASLVAVLVGASSAWFLPYWCHFVAGALCYRALADPVDQAWFYPLMTLFAGTTLAALFSHAAVNGDAAFPQMVVGLLAAGTIFAVGRAGRLTTLWSNPVIQYFGRISYSLYLVHVTVAVAVLQLGYKLTGENPRMALGWFALSGLASIAVAHGFYTLIERPCLRLASNFGRRPTRQPIATQPRVATD